tara:strand:- start:438 stop:875 length:438 start_codon:yes stop_codon:yes gene_type:complete
VNDHQEGISAVQIYLLEEMGVDTVFGPDELSAYWLNGGTTISINTKQNKRLQLYCILHEAGHAILRSQPDYETNFPYGDNRKNKSIARRIDVLREEVMAWEEGSKLAQGLGIELDSKLWHKFLKKNLFDYVRWAYDPESSNADFR